MKRLSATKLYVKNKERALLIDLHHENNKSLKDSFKLKEDRNAFQKTLIFTFCLIANWKL